jgi:hypothetical protein
MTDSLSRTLASDVSAVAAGIHIGGGTVLWQLASIDARSEELARLTSHCILF